MTPKESKVFNLFVFVQLVYFFNSFGVRLLANVQQRQLIIQYAFGGIFADFGWKMAQDRPQKVKYVKLFVHLTLSVSFYLKLETFQ